MRLNPQFWFEFSVWNGYQAGSAKSTVRRLRKAGQTCSPGRWQRSRDPGCGSRVLGVVRDFRGWTEPWVDVMGENGGATHERGGPDSLAVMNAVDRVHANPALRQWRRRGN